MWESIFILVGNLPHMQYKRVVKRDVEGRVGKKKRNTKISSREMGELQFGFKAS